MTTAASFWSEVTSVYHRHMNLPEGYEVEEFDAELDIPDTDHAVCSGEDDDTDE